MVTQVKRNLLTPTEGLVINLPEREAQVWDYIICFWNSFSENLISRLYILLCVLISMLKSWNSTLNMIFIFI